MRYGITKEGETLRVYGFKQAADLGWWLASCCDENAVRTGAGSLVVGVDSVIRKCRRCGKTTERSRLPAYSAPLIRARQLGTIVIAAPSAGRRGHHGSTDGLRGVQCRVAVSLARQLQRHPERASLAVMDIVGRYFRSRGYGWCTCYFDPECPQCSGHGYRVDLELAQNGGFIPDDR